MTSTNHHEPHATPTEQPGMPPRPVCTARLSIGYWGVLILGAIAAAYLIISR